MTGKTFIIAEAGVNHNGSLARALKMVTAASKAGADAIKFQSFITEQEVTRTAPKAQYQRRNTGSGGGQFAMLKALELSFVDQRTLMRACRKAGIAFMSTPFDPDSTRFLITASAVKMIKVASGEITNGPMLLAMARSRKPIIMSTGMSTEEDVRQALGVIAFGAAAPKSAAPSARAFAKALTSPRGRMAVRKRVTLLQCTTAYPAPAASINLAAMSRLAETFGVKVGLSDHSRGIAVATAAVARGAAVIEKHFTLDRALPGPDHKASLTPAELRQMVIAIRTVEQAIGSANKKPQAIERDARAVARKSLVALRTIRKGERFTEKNLGAKRPGGGLSPMTYWTYLGQAASRDYAADELIAEKP